MSVSRATSSGIFGPTVAAAAAAAGGGMSSVKTVIGVYVVTGDNQKDFYHRQPVSTKLTAADVVASVVPKLFGKEAKVATYALYEAVFQDLSQADVHVAVQDHVAKDDQWLSFMKNERIVVTSRPSNDIWEGQVDGNKGKFPSKLVRPMATSARQTMTRTCLRVLGDAEVPLFVQYNWKNLPNGANMTFVLKEREPELRENATKEFYANFSATKLRALLDSLNEQEAKALADIEAKYAAQRQLYTQALQQIKKK